MAEIISLRSFNRSLTSRVLAKPAASKSLVKHAALAHIERARKLLLKLEGEHKQQAWMLEDLAETLKQSVG
ncbi:MAG: hypothetical protein K1X79_14300 [Oligoflexia bacterium]|nr:hypothetical protein [Oligoflexia bacterium]